MSEYWVSNKKYFCKYCEIYIADDAPSRRQHESGLRHKGNRERFVRNLYKQGERRNKDLAEEKREMARVEAAANAAFARDVSTGNASLASSSSQPSRPAPAAPKKPERPTSVWSNYTTAQSLGITDPDEGRMKAEIERRKTQGIVGEWEIVAPPPPPPLPANMQVPKEEESKEGVLPETTPQKREAEAAVDAEDTRSFKLRKRTIDVGFGGIWDLGNIPIRLKSKAKKESPENSILDRTIIDNEAGHASPSSSDEPSVLKGEKSQMQSSNESRPKWRPLHLKRRTELASLATPGSSGESVEQMKSNAADPSFKKEDESVELHPDLSSSQMFEDGIHPKVELSNEEAKVDMKLEEDSAPAKPEPTGGLFKKRKVPTAARGRRG